MNSYSIMTAALVAASVISSQAATVTVYITGSTAFRANVNAILGGVADHNGNTPNCTVFNGGGSTGHLPAGPINLDGSSYVFTGPLNGSGDILMIKTSFSGSEAGIASLVDQPVLNGAANLPGTPQPAFLNDNGTPNAANYQQPDIAMADTSPLVSLTQSPRIHDKGITGVVQFTWMKAVNGGQTGWADFKNITIPQINTVLSAGSQDITYFTGISADYGTQVGACGRNKGSGTRVNTLIEALYHGNVSQYAINPTYTANVLNKLGAPVVGFTKAQWVNIGNDGYDSGAGVASCLGSTPVGQWLDANNNNIWVLPIGYIGLVDASTIAGVSLTKDNNFTYGNNGYGYYVSGGQFLTLNGNYYSDQAIANGAYDLWGHEHMVTSDNTSTAGNNVANSLLSDIPSSVDGGQDGFPYITSGGNRTMYADRPLGADTGFVAPF